MATWRDHRPRKNRTWPGDLFQVRWLLFLFLALASAVAVKAPVAMPPDPEFRTLHGVVLDESGQPASGRTVRLIGLSRGSERPYNDSASLPNWDFVTDSAGRFTVKLGDFAPWNDSQHRPGWGGYGLVVDAGPQDAGAVGDLLLFDGDGRRGAPSNMEWGTAVAVPRGESNVTLQIRKGIVFGGRLWNAANPSQPLAGIHVYVNLDLHSESHSGHGSEILQQSATTAADGTFVFAHVYPNRFWIGVGGPYGFRNRDEDEGYWLKSKVGDAWVDEVRDEITPINGTAPPSLEILAARTPSFTYSGRVTDAQGQPVTQAKVGFGVSYHPIVDTFEDDHSYANAATAKDGTFRVLLPTPWVRGFDVEAPGFVRYDQWFNDTTLKPGTYAITLQREL